MRAAPRVITVEYREGGTENPIQLRQVNILSDRDLITSDDIRYADGSVVVPSELQLGDRFAELVAQANDVAPGGIPDFQPTPEMPADVYIQTHERACFEYLMRPLKDGMAGTFRET